MLAFRRSPYLSKGTRAFISNMSSGISLALLTALSFLMPAVQVKRADVNTDSRVMFPVSYPGGRSWLVDPSQQGQQYAIAFLLLHFSTSLRIHLIDYNSCSVPFKVLLIYLTLYIFITPSANQ